MHRSSLQINLILGRKKYKLDSRIDEMFLEGSQLYGLKNIFCKIFSFIPSDHGHKSYSYNYEKFRLACF